ncbi:3-hydroxyacyl-CoA dehydrogenase [Fulvimarina endophytica]|uniref:3-hydroxyacyl-CoA dehydrogenase n=1 Tax=Fulvimarina endophytica TaxID=2293836 RepID=A0A371WYX6_9HYPH|nr:3-hydroxyacyl-CoA dehydrogenase [Fulvimarina endophytica]RFC62191.1 3-hydroxyacyl-CoA dehydrogenase [Fulvimarina endophytica]
MTRVSIVGAGLIGKAWAVVFARAGMDVALWDANEAVVKAAPADLSAMVSLLAERGLVDEPFERVAGRVRPFARLEEALEGADLVQESGPERLPVKQALFADLDRLAPPSAILASSSSALKVSSYTASLEGRARCLVAHPVNPPHLVPVVELSPGPDTAPATLDAAEAIYKRAGQVPVRLAREIDGFVLNRLQAVVLAEALRLVDEGIVSVEGLDDTIKHGLGRRWAFMGPFETINLNAPLGVMDYAERFFPTMAALADDSARGEAFTMTAAQKVAAHFGPAPEAGEIRKAQEVRDARLAGLQAHLSAHFTDKTRKGG